MTTAKEINFNWKREKDGLYIHWHSISYWSGKVPFYWLIKPDNGLNSRTDHNLLIQSGRFNLKETISEAIDSDESEEIPSMDCLN